MNVAIIHNPLTHHLQCDACRTLAFLAVKENYSQTGQNKNSTFNFVVIRKYPPSKNHLF